MSNDNQQQQPSQPYAVKLESTQKGVRITVHVYGPEGLSEANRKLAVDEAINTFDETVRKLGDKGYQAESKPAEVAK